MEYRFLADFELDVLHAAFLEAFSDYVTPLRLTKEQFAELLTRRGADMNLSVGAFDENRLVGFNLNALDDFNGKRTVYDIITGVVPSHRRGGIAKALFDFSLPGLRATKAEQYILEVIRTNDRAVLAYRKVGFSVNRTLEAFQREADAIPPLYTAVDEELRVFKPDWQVVQKFWDSLPSWQNSIRSIERSRGEKIVLGAFSNNELVGYAIAYLANGDIPQFAVDRSFRRRGVGSALLNSLQRLLSESAAARIVNLDAADRGTAEFLRRIGFQNFLGQYEMKLNFTA